LSQISVPSYEASRYATEALVHCKVNRALRTRAELMHGTKKDGSRPIMLKTDCPLSMFHSNSRSSPPRQHPKFSQFFTDWLPAFAHFRHHPPLFVALFRTLPLFVALWSRKLCRQTVTSMLSASQLPVAAIVTPGKIDFFFDENAGMPPAAWAARLFHPQLAWLPARL
jgi:hypothetical protein